MNVKVVRGKEKAALYECDAVHFEKEGPDTLVTPVRIRIEQDNLEPQVIARISLPRDGDTVYVENSSGRTIDTFRAGEELPAAGRPLEILDGEARGAQGGQGEEERTRVFRGLPRGSVPEDLDVVGIEGGKASIPVVRPAARG